MNKLITFVFFLRILNCIHGIDNASVEFRSFYHVLEHDNTIPQHNILMISNGTESLSKCNSICSQRPDCSSFFYHLKGQTCICIGHVTGADLVPSLGYMHFKSDKEISNWVSFGKSFYLVVEVSMNILDAQFQCMKFGSKLVEIELLAENLFLKDLARTTMQDILIGATDIFKEGTWMYLSSWRNITYEDWYPGEPNNFRSIEHCVVMSSSKDFQWDDHDCNEKYSFICEQMTT